MSVACAFGHRKGPRLVARGRQVWWSQLLFTWTVQRLSLWRSLTQPVYQLEGRSILKARTRVRQIRRRNTGSALMMTQAFYASEAGLTIAMLSLVFWFAPSGRAPDVFEVLSGQGPGFLTLAIPIAYALASFSSNRLCSGRVSCI